MLEIQVPTLAPSGESQPSDDLDGWQVRLDHPARIADQRARRPTRRGAMVTPDEPILALDDRGHVGTTD